MLEVKFLLYVSVWYVWQQWISLQNNVGFEHYSFFNAKGIFVTYVCRFMADSAVFFLYIALLYTNG